VAAAVISTPHPTPGQAAATPAGGMPTALPTLSTLPSTNQPFINMPNITSVLEIGLACLVIVVLLAGLVIFLIVRGQKRNRQ
jgi:hypothetical protein